MKRVNYHLTEKQIDALRGCSIDTGLTVAELIRRAIDEWLGRWKIKEEACKRIRNMLGSNIIPSDKNRLRKQEGK